MGASEAVDRALGRPVARPVPRTTVTTALGPAAAKSPAAPSHDAAGPDAAGADAAGPGTGPTAAPLRQTLPPPPGAPEPAPVYAMEYAFFLDADAATRFSAALASRGLSARLVEQRDETGRTWTYVRSQVFVDAAVALAFAAKVEQSFGISTSLVTEPVIPLKAGAP